MWRPGQKIGNYELIAQLREGGMATLFLAKLSGAAGFSRLVAIKVVHVGIIAMAAPSAVVRHVSRGGLPTVKRCVRTTAVDPRLRFAAPRLGRGKALMISGGESVNYGRTSIA